MRTKFENKIDILLNFMETSEIKIKKMCYIKTSFTQFNECDKTNVEEEIMIKIIISYLYWCLYFFVI